MISTQVRNFKEPTKETVDSLLPWYENPTCTRTSFELDRAIDVSTTNGRRILWSSKGSAQGRTSAWADESRKGLCESVSLRVSKPRGMR